MTDASSRVVSDKLSAPAPVMGSRKIVDEFGGMYVPESPALAISDLVFTITRSSITLSYTINAEASCKVSYATEYNVELMQISFALFSPNHSSHAHKISGLAEGTIYWLRVRAFDSSGNNAFSPSVSSWHAVRSGTATVAGEYIGVIE